MSTNIDVTALIALSMGATQANGLNLLADSPARSCAGDAGLQVNRRLITAIELSGI